MVGPREWEACLWGRRERRKNEEKKGRWRVYGGWQLTSEWLRPRQSWVSQSQVNDFISWGWLEKTGGPKIFCVGVEPAETDVPLADTRRNEEDESFWGRLWEDVRRKRQLNTNHEDVRGRKLTNHILGVRSEKWPYTIREPVKTKPAGRAC